MRNMVLSMKSAIRRITSFGWSDEETQAGSGEEQTGSCDERAGGGEERAGLGDETPAGRGDDYEPLHHVVIAIIENEWNFPAVHPGGWRYFHGNSFTKYDEELANKLPSVVLPLCSLGPKSGGLVAKTYMDVNHHDNSYSSSQKDTNLAQGEEIFSVFSSCSGWTLPSILSSNSVLDHITCASVHRTGLYILEPRGRYANLIPSRWSKASEFSCLLLC